MKTAEKETFCSLAVCSQATITLSAYEHIIEREGAKAAIEAFRKNIEN